MRANAATILIRRNAPSEREDMGQDPSREP
jgi:hypothetical protein